MCRHGVGGKRCLAIAYGDGVSLCFRCEIRRGACTCRCRSCDPRGPRSHTEPIDAHIEAPTARTAWKEGHHVGVTGFADVAQGEGLIGGLKKQGESLAFMLKQQEESFGGGDPIGVPAGFVDVAQGESPERGGDPGGPGESSTKQHAVKHETYESPESAGEASTKQHAVKDETTDHGKETMSAKMQDYASTAATIIRILTLALATNRCQGFDTEAAAAYDGDAFMIALPIRGWLLLFLSVVIAGYVAFGKMASMWNQFWRKPRRAKQPRQQEAEDKIPTPHTSKTYSVNSITQTETTYHRNYATPRFGPSTTHGAWIDV
jgi:hypothetical protein